MARSPECECPSIIRRRLENRQRVRGPAYVRELLRTMEQTRVDGFATHMTLHGFHDVGPCFLPRGRRLHVKLGVERKDLNCVVMFRPGCRRARSAVYGAGG